MASTGGLIGGFDCDISCTRCDLMVVGTVNLYIQRVRQQDIDEQV